MASQLRAFRRKKITNSRSSRSRKYIQIQAKLYKNTKALKEKN